MNYLSHLKSKLNCYSVIGSLTYGTISTASTMLSPDINHKSLYVLSFILSCFFYFFMYVLYTNKKVNWTNTKPLVIRSLQIMSVFTVTATVLFMIRFNVSYFKALGMIANGVQIVGNYLLFLP